jgi:hypothetical protein
MQAIDDALRDLAEEAHTTSITPAMLRQALLAAFPNTPDATLDEFCRRAFGSKWDRPGKVSSSLMQVRGRSALGQPLAAACA